MSKLPPLVWQIKAWNVMFYLPTHRLSNLALWKWILLEIEWLKVQSGGKNTLSLGDPLSEFSSGIWHCGYWASILGETLWNFQNFLFLKSTFRSCERGVCATILQIGLKDPQMLTSLVDVGQWSPTHAKRLWLWRIFPVPLCCDQTKNFHKVFLGVLGSESFHKACNWCPVQDAEQDLSASCIQGGQLG